MNTQTPTTAGAVFLSYASQDAPAARRIYETLRAAGIEVWFDLDELVGGDLWDAKIKRQIRECALFVPIISANTQARGEGYFRREWNLATQRLLDMAPGRPFLLPVAIDETSEQDALVAEEFLRVQWLRLPQGTAAPASVDRVRELLRTLAQGTTDPFPRRTGLPAVPPRRKTGWRAVQWMAVAALVATVVALSVVRTPAAAPRTKQLAVLPFNTIGEGAGSQAFCDGLAETITSQLTQLEQFQRTLLVVPMSEVRKEAIVTPSQARTIFGATLVLAGSVQRAEMLVRVTVSLVDTASLRIIRSGTYDQPPTELYRLQDRVAAQAAAWLGLDLTAEAKNALAAGQTNVGSAYDFYVQGRGELARREVAGNLDAAILHLQEALVADPRYALAHAALGEAYWAKYLDTKERRWVDEARRSCTTALQHGAGLATPHITLAMLLNGTGAYEPAVAEAETALQLDPASAEATRVLARAFDRLGRSAEAEAAFKRAIERNPSNVQPITDLAVFFWRIGRMADAEKYFLRAAELTPQNYALYRNLGGLYVMMGRATQAAEQLEKSIALKPTAPAYSNLGTLRFQQGRYAEAAMLFEGASRLRPREYVFLGNLGDALRFVPGRAEDANRAYARAISLAQEAIQVNPQDPAAHASLARYHAFSGNPARALEEIAQAVALGSTIMPVLFNAALVYERIGDRQRALDAVGLALKGGYSPTDINQDPDLRELRTDPRFAALASESVQTNRK